MAGYSRPGKEVGAWANMFDEVIQTHVEVAEEALDAAIDNTIDALTGDNDDKREDD